jgi:2-succinyl-6-hydroxy-2,4-cyclohexadiene-1-carboxylate synthase
MPKVVLVPGFTQTAASWRDVAEVVETSCEVFAMDVPIREDFAHTASAIGARGGHAIYVGYSMGGRLCLRLAIDHPEVVHGLVLVSSTAGIADDGARAARIESDEELARSIERDGVGAFLDAWLAQPLFATIPPGAAGLDERRALAPSVLTHGLRVLGAGAMEPLWDRLPELRMPVALVTGRLDTRYESLALQMLERITSDVVHVPIDGGHALPLEQPAVLGGFIAAFAAQHG